MTDHTGRRRYEVRHVTRYSYDDLVEACYERGFLRPRGTESQVVLASDLEVTPRPESISDHVDYFGNRSTYLEVRSPHTELVVASRSRVEVEWHLPDRAELDAWTVGEAAAVVLEEMDPVDAADYLMPSSLVRLGRRVRAYAGEILPPDRPLGQALSGLVARIYTDFQYRQGATSVKTTLGELLDLRSGVCQDFAHLAVGCLRSVGLPARYVSGYVETSPPPGAEKLEGADASHAWASVLTPGGRWLDLDPTNNHFVDSRYIVTAWGRDFADVSPLRGVVYTESTSSDLVVEVDVNPLPLVLPQNDR